MALGSAVNEYIKGKYRDERPGELETYRDKLPSMLLDEGKFVLIQGNEIWGRSTRTLGRDVLQYVLQSVTLRLAAVVALCGTMSAVPPAATSMVAGCPRIAFDEVPAILTPGKQPFFQDGGGPRI